MVQAATQPPEHQSPPAIDGVALLKKAGDSAAKGGTDTLKKWWGSIGGPAQKDVGGAAYLDELKAIAAKVDATKEYWDMVERNN